MAEDPVQYRALSTTKAFDGWPRHFRKLDHRAEEPSGNTHTRSICRFRQAFSSVQRSYRVWFARPQEGH